MARSLQVDRLWNGDPADPGEFVRVELIESATELRVVVDAPHHRDPVPVTPAGRCDGLWEFEVVELFLVGADEHYLELEFGPAGHWLALRLEGVRKILDANVPVDYSVERSGDRWHSRATIARGHAPTPILRWNAFAIHGRALNRRYLAAGKVPGEEPDFHRLDLFPQY